jgi:uncharacterized membrane protein
MVYLWGVMLAFIPFCFLQAHEGHHPQTNQISINEPLLNEMQVPPSSDSHLKEENNQKSWIQWLGGLHLVFLHFPIALIMMTVVAELLLKWKEDSFFDNAASFMLVSAAILTPPTALLGFALSDGQIYEGTLNDLYVWHRYFGIVTAILALWAVSLRTRAVRLNRSRLSYAICLFFLFLSVNLAGLFGGGLAFGW